MSASSLHGRINKGKLKQAVSEHQAVASLLARMMSSGKDLRWRSCGRTVLDLVHIRPREQDRVSLGQYSILEE
jgi:hypothetical protein